MLFYGLLEDAAIAAADQVHSEDVVERHLGYRNAWFSEVVGRLVMPDRRLAEVGRQLPDGSSIRTTVINTGGAGGLIALAGRAVPGITVAAVESPLRDLDDLAGNAQRVVAAAGELASEVEIFVGLPYSRGWQAAVGLVEAAGLFGKISVVDEMGRPAQPDRLVEQLSILVEADLPFAVTGLNRALSQPESASSGQSAQPYGFLALLCTLDALIDGADQYAAAELLQSRSADQVATTIAGWDDARQHRVRRRIRNLDNDSIQRAIQDLVGLGLIAPA
jgi:hypothetical protein